MGETAQRISPRDAVDPITSGWIATALGMIDQHGGVVRASLIEVKGSAPREAGAMMLITDKTTTGTIGGGSLEFEVMAAARKMIGDYGGSVAADPIWDRRVISAALGPDMGQCCGGHVRVLLELFGAAEYDHLCGLATSCTSDVTPLLRHPLTKGAALASVPRGTTVGLAPDKSFFVAPLYAKNEPLFLYGAGHIGRALVGHLMALEFDVHWVDVARERFPDDGPGSARQVIASDPVTIAKHAPAGAVHLVITHSHALDEAICYQVLSDARFARLGLIGSATKAARFRARLSKAGISEQLLARLVCPVGLPVIKGKAPARVALSIAAAVAIWQQELDIENTNPAIAALH